MSFDVEKLRARTREYRDALPLDEIQITEARELIDIGSLTERNSKRVSAVAIYADLDGFTRYVQEAEDDDRVISLVRKLHMIRHEFHAVIEQDYPGIVLQHQGDRVFAIVHLPSDDLARACDNGLNLAIGLQSSMEHVLNDRLQDQKDIHVAVGLDSGTVLVTRLGKKGARENICIGPEVTSAEQLQLKSSGTQIRISKRVYDAITDEAIRGWFARDGVNTYLANGLTFPRLDEHEEEQAAREDKLGARVDGNRIEVATNANNRAKPWGNTKPWCTR